MLLLELDLEHLPARVLGPDPGEQPRQRQDAAGLARGAHPLVIVILIGPDDRSAGEQRDGGQEGEDRTGGDRRLHVAG